jgi:RimJ/RimL family protein N-acetyltransferase
LTFKPLIVLETERLILRRFTADDADNLEELDSDPEVTRYVTRASNRTIPAMHRYYDSHPEFGTWAGVEKASGEFIGWFHLGPAHENGRDAEPELGYRFRRVTSGRGYATEGSRALIDKAFTDLNAWRVFALTMTVCTATSSTRSRASSGKRIRPIPTLDPDDAWRRLAEARVAYLATVRADGRPHAVPIVFAVDHDRVVYPIADPKPKEGLDLLLRIGPP